MIDRLVKILEDNKKVFAYNVIETNTDSYQLFFIKQALDMNREVNVKEYKVTLFIKNKSDDKDKMGKVSFDIYPSMSDEEITSKIEEQVGYAKYTLANAFNLPKKGSIKPTKGENGFNGKSLKEAAFIVADAIFEADKYDKGYINSTEIFISNVETRYVDSNGNDFSYVNQKGEVEFITTWVEHENEIELYKFIRFNTLDQDYIIHECDSMLSEASNRIKANKTPALNNVKLVVSKEYVNEYFFHFIKKCNVESIYKQSSDYYVGKDINGSFSKADKITIRLEPTLKGSTIGRPFDDEGIILKKLPIIEKGVVSNIWGENAKSQYLGKTPNGSYKNFVVSAGTLTNEELSEENYVEIVSVSGFDIDPITGDFGSEIRLAYLYQKGKERQIITGGSVSGNIIESLSTVRFSNDVVQNDNFIVPSKILLDKVKFNKG